MTCDDTEFGSESLMCIIELVRFKHHLLEDEECKTENDKYPALIKFPESVNAVQSYIVDNSTLSNEKKFNLLCSKYIASNALFSANISFRARERVLDMSTADETINHTVFDEVILGIVRLMKDPLWRFTRSDAFQELKGQSKSMFWPLFWLLSYAWNSNMFWVVLCLLRLFFVAFSSLVILCLCFFFEYRDVFNHNCWSLKSKLLRSCHATH